MEFERDIYRLPAYFAGLQYLESPLDSNWRTKLVGYVHSARRVPMLSILPSLATVLLSVVRLVVSAVILPFALLAVMIAPRNPTSIWFWTRCTGSGIGASLSYILVHSINIATLGFLGWRMLPIAYFCIKMNW